MAKTKTFKIFNLENWHGGGTFFADGLYKVESCRYTMFDFNGSIPEGVCCLTIKYQPLNRDFKPEGDPQVQYYGLQLRTPGLDTEEWKEAQRTLKPSKDGKRLEGGEFDLDKKCDAFLLMTSLKDAGFPLEDLEEEDDVSKIDGLIAEMGTTISTRKPKDGPKARKDSNGVLLPLNTVVVKSIPANTKAAGGKSNGKAAVNGSGKKKEEEADDELDPKTLLIEYMQNVILVDDNAEGYDKLKARMGISSYIQKQKGGDADLVKKVVDNFNDEDTLAAILESASWAIKSEKGKNLIHYAG